MDVIIAVIGALVLLGMWDRHTHPEDYGPRLTTERRVRRIWHAAGRHF